jgi:hypothetical protein
MLGSCQLHSSLKEQIKNIKISIHSRSRIHRRIHPNRPAEFACRKKLQPDG